MADETPAPQTATADEEAKPDYGGKPVIAVKVYAPFKVYYEGDCFSLSAINATGPFDVLPHHHNFLCMLVPSDLRLETPQGPRMIKVNRALMHVKAEKVTVFMDV